MHKMQVLNSKEDTRCKHSLVIETYVFGSLPLTGRHFITKNVLQLEDLVFFTK
jgi:hypothetical protein